jgi:hypothetical protein
MTIFFQPVERTRASVKGDRVSDPASRLPARPSLEQLRKQAKERHQALRAGDPDASLADAQHALARDYGFEHWPALVHHVESLQSSERVDLFERLARDMLAGYAGDAAALERLGAHFGDSYDNAQRLERIRDRVDALHDRAAEPTLDDTRRVVARQFGFDSWAALSLSLTQRPAGSGAATGAITGPPYFSVDVERNTIQPRGPLTERDWDAILDVMAARRITGIETPAITDRALDRLSRLDFVTRIRMDGVRQVSDEGLQHLARMPQLVELDLGGWYCPLTDRGLEVVRHLKALRRFTLCWGQRVSDAGVANLAFCDDLESVNLLGTPTGDGAINALRGKRRLRSLHTGRLVTDRGIPLLHDLPVFTTPQRPEFPYGLMSFTAGANDLLLDGPFTDAGLAALAGLDGLFGLSFFWHSPAFTAAGIAALAGLPNLVFLGCQGDRCDDAAMRSIAALPHLRMLMGQGAVAGDDGFIALSRSPTLEYFWGRECPNLRGPGFAALAALPALRGLGVSCALVDDASLATLPRFPALRELMPMDVPDAGFRHVGACARLERLWCMYCRDTGDAATGHVAGLPLKTYYAGKTKITDKSLEILGRMGTLEEIELWEIAGITDHGIASLVGLPRLRKASISGCPNVTRAGTAGFPATVRVDYP